MTAQALPFIGRRATAGSARPIAWVVLAVVAVALYLLFRDQWTLPYERGGTVAQAGNDLRDTIGELSRTNPIVGFVLGGARAAVAWLVSSITGLLTALGWPGLIAVSALIAYAAGTWRTAALAVSGFLVIGALGLWQSSVLTLGLTLAAVLLSLLFGIPLGILTAKSDRFRSVITPVLDVMQIMPQFAYLIPFVLLFGIGAPAAAIVTMIYAMPATIRITAMGIRGVSATTVEAARSAGATNGQILRSVEIPLSRRAIGLAVNQTIMLALSMVIITVFIDGPGLGVDILRPMQRLAIGAIFEAGLAVVILAIILDRITEQASHRMDARAAAFAGSGRRVPTRRAVLIALGIVAAVTVVIGLVMPGAVSRFPPELASLSIAGPIDAAAAWVRTNLYLLTSTFREAVTAVVINPLAGTLVSAPFWLVIGVGGAVAYLVSGGRAALVAVIGLLLVAGLQLWEHAMQTLALVVIATVATLAIGTGLGILAARSDGFSRGIRPLLDAAQTMPAFVYLLPALALFGVGRFTAIAASIVFAVPPVVRLVETGIRMVPPTVVEASLSAGATGGQLLRKVQLPISRPALMLAANQGLIMVLGMVVLGGIVGAGGLGYDVVNGFAQRRDFGEGLAAGISIVLLGIVLDRITQGAGRRPAPTMGARA
jgi:glycine betaine/proline transport system permease protein